PAEEGVKMRKLLVGVVALVAMTAALEAQKVKSQKEAEALNAVFQAQDPDGRIKAAEALLSKFADTDFKATVLYVMTVSAQQKGDVDKTIIYGERTLEADPKHYPTMLILASTIAGRTREFDLDKEEKLARVEKLTKDADALLKTATKMNPNMTD